MYEIRPESIKTFIEDTSITLPRFQRKQTWDDSKNFKLCISVFKEYPIGVSILSIERGDNNKITKWLLDGRQRRNALTRMSEDPENIYQWGKKFLGFKENMQPHDLEDRFWLKINEYLEIDGESEDKQDVSSDEDSNIISEPDDINYDTSQSGKSGFDLLLSILLLVHNKTKRYSGFSKPFDFTKYINNLPYIDNGDGRPSLNSKKIKSFIKGYQGYCKDEALEYENLESFTQFLKDRFGLSKDIEQKLSVNIKRDWDKIIDRIQLVNKIDNLLLNAKIGLIEVKTLNISDGQKIFNIINTEGTQLTAIEVLSAKPNWNKEIHSPSRELTIASQKLYETIGIKNTNVVRWDVPATLIDRLNGVTSVFSEFNSSKGSEFEKKLTLGFKLLSGLRGSGVKKDDINKLSTSEQINWDLGIEDLINDLNLYLKLLNESDYFKFFLSWKGCVMDLLSDAPALNFLLISFKDWLRKGKPIGSSTTVKQFQKNCFVLIDRLIYEYINRIWRGSSDALIAQNIKEFPSSADLFNPIEKEKWLVILKDIFDKNSIGDLEITMQTLRPLLYHFYCISNIAGPDSNLFTIEVDHIIPVSVFAVANISDKEIVQNNLFNLALLPKRDNISKSNLKLSQIDDHWLIEQIGKYAFIQSDEFSKYSTLNNIEELKAKRRVFFEEAFSVKRDNILR